MDVVSSVMKEARRIVVKVGSSLVTNDGRALDLNAMSNWAAQIATLRADGREVILVSSGAIAAGMQALGWSKRPQELDRLQAAAAVGQMGLAHAYETRFQQHQLRCAQILLTHADLADRERYLNARSTLLTLLNLGVIPIINENDTVVTDEIKFGDNDTLGALVANLVDADALVILTDQSGLYTADPRKNPEAQLVRDGIAGDPCYVAMAGGAGSSIGRGGMMTKILAAGRAARSGASTVIASGREQNVLVRLSLGESIGTQLRAKLAPLTARKQWLADHLQLRGSVVLDDGAVRALSTGGKSLLPVGVTSITGEFARGDVVQCIGIQGNEIARGIVNYSSDQAKRIVGQASSKIAEILGESNGEELIHRDNLVIC